jgi:2-haloalkanoic acid dehalogenase type II
VPRYDVITFDCYGTLIDWESGIREAFRAAAREDGVSLREENVIPAYSRIEPDVEEGPYRAYREVLAETARRVGAELDWEIAPERARFLPESLPAWLPFPDTNPALRRLTESGCRLGILSNVDDDLLDATRGRLDAAFDPVVTAAQVRSYKPGPAHFLEARRRLGSGAKWLHAAQSDFHDVQPCARLRIPVAWINRKSEKPREAGLTVHESRDLADFARWIAED